MFITRNVSSILLLSLTYTLICFYFQDYIHRIGRSGRGEGKKGQALLFLCPHELEFIAYLKKFDVSLDHIEFDGSLDEINEKVSWK